MSFVEGDDTTSGGVIANGDESGVGDCVQALVSCERWGGLDFAKDLLNARLGIGCVIAVN